MRNNLRLAGIALTLVASTAFAHKEPAAGVRPAADSVVQSPATSGTRDPRAYFTDADLMTQDGQKIKFYSDMLKGKTVVMNVMYTSCTEACPLITKQLSQVRDELGNMFDSKIFFVSITSDPARDTPQALKKFAQKQSADSAGWTFLTGRKNDVNLILKRLGALSENVEEHATVLYIMDVDRKRMRRMLPNLPPKAIAEAARIIASNDKTPGPGTLPRVD